MRRSRIQCKCKHRGISRHQKVDQGFKKKFFFFLWKNSDYTEFNGISSVKVYQLTVYSYSMLMWNTLKDNNIRLKHSYIVYIRNNFKISKSDSHITLNKLQNDIFTDF